MEQTKQALIYTKLPKIMQEVKAIGKNQTNQEQGFNFRGIDDIYNAMHDILARHEVFCTSVIKTSEHKEVISKRGIKGTHSIVSYTFKYMTTDGSYIETDAIGEAIDYGDKGVNKCFSIAHKYSLIGLFLIPTADPQDPDANSHEIVQPQRNQQVAEPLRQVVNQATPQVKPHKPSKFISQACPNCGNEKAVRKSKFWKEGSVKEKKWYCYKKIEGCGHQWNDVDVQQKYADTEPETTEKSTENKESFGDFNERKNNEFTGNQTIIKQQQKLLFDMAERNKMPAQTAKDLIGQFGYKEAKDIKKKDFSNIATLFESWSPPAIPLKEPELPLKDALSEEDVPY